MDLGAVGAGRVAYRNPDTQDLRGAVGETKDLVEILDVAAFTEVLSERGLHRGQVGTVVEAPAPDVFEIEFSDGEGRAYASLAANAGQLLSSATNDSG